MKSLTNGNTNEEYNAGNINIKFKKIMNKNLMLIYIPILVFILIRIIKNR